MKGVRLFARPAGAEDDPRLRAFWIAEGREPEAGSAAVIGFLLGEIVASISFDRDGQTLRIRDFWVARNLRRKRVGRAMLAELDVEALGLGAARLIIRPPSDFIDAFRRLGFSDAGGGELVRPVERAR